MKYINARSSLKQANGRSSKLFAPTQTSLSSALFRQLNGYFVFDLQGQRPGFEAPGVIEDCQDFHAMVVALF